MGRFTGLLVAWLGLAGMAFAAAPREELVQGLYEGALQGVAGRRQAIEVRVVACGQGAYKAFLRQPWGEGKAADAAKAVQAELDGKMEGDVLRFSGKAADAVWTASYADGALRGTCGPGAGGQEVTFQAKRVLRKPSTLGAKAPPGAVVLLDGKDFSELVKKPLRGGAEQPWKLTNDGGSIEVPKGGMNSKRRFGGSFRLHVEFKIPLMPKARGQGRGNSGVYLPNGDEIQVLDSFGMTTYKGGGCGGLYAYKNPDTFDQFSLASLPPLEWQTYDVEYRVQKKDGKLVGKPRVTVYHNGIKIHGDAGLNIPASVGGFHFQDHGNPVEYRNIWVLPAAEK